MIEWEGPVTSQDALIPYYDVLMTSVWWVGAQAWCTLGDYGGCNTMETVNGTEAGRWVAKNPAVTLLEGVDIPSSR
jgi:hypothetical protein